MAKQNDTTNLSRFDATYVDYNAAKAASNAVAELPAHGKNALVVPRFDQWEYFKNKSEMLTSNGVVPGGTATSG